MSDTPATFWQRAGRILNAGQAPTLLLTGNVHDLFLLDQPDGAAYVPLAQLLAAKWLLPNRILIVYETNGPIRFLREQDREKILNAWIKWKTGFDANDLAIQRMLASGRQKADLDAVAKAFDSNLRQAIGSPTIAFELLRQICLCSRTRANGAPLLAEDLIVVIEAADMALPDAPLHSLSDADRHRISICQDWFSDPGFLDSNDAVILISESRSLINRRVGSLPQIMEVEVPSPSRADRLAFIEWFENSHMAGSPLRLWSSREDLASLTAGLSIHALRQLLRGAAYQGGELSPKDVIEKVEDFIQSELGEDIVEFKKPKHRLDSLVGFSALKTFLRDELIPRFRSGGPDALPGAAVCGPIGGGKTFIFEALAAELDMVVLVLKSIRSQWFGQTDVIFERLRRVLIALDKVLIFVDEADTQFGGVGADTHETERRLTGKIQAMMSDSALRGRVTWLLMTARIELLSPDIRRPGRVGDLIIPVLDPEGDDRRDFIRWAIEPALGRPLADDEWPRIDEAMTNQFSAGFAALRSELKARRHRGELSFDDILAVIHDQLSPAIGAARRYQTLQALLNCTRRSLLPDPSITEQDRQNWAAEARRLQSVGF